MFFINSKLAVRACVDSRTTRADHTATRHLRPHRFHGRLQQPNALSLPGSSGCSEALEIVLILSPKNGHHADSLQVEHALAAGEPAPCRNIAVVPACSLRFMTRWQIAPPNFLTPASSTASCCSDTPQKTFAVQNSTFDSRAAAIILSTCNALAATPRRPSPLTLESATASCGLAFAIYTATIGTSMPSHAGTTRWTYVTPAAERGELQI